MKLYTIGYEGALQPEVIERLRAAGVTTLIDVRAVAASRRAGFSKTLLANSLAEAGIDYLHLRGVGTPKTGRDAARAGRTEEMRAIYRDAMAEPAFELDYARLKDRAVAGTTALLCFCGEAAHCHRRLLSNRLAAEDGFEVIDL